MKAPIDDRLLPSGDEAGTAPGDRKFRPDVQGLRAVAIVLVVLFHAGVPGVSGGYVGVDVFFVISGFVITGVLLRERSPTGRTSILAFYGRRARRIIPAATLVILAIVLGARWFLDPLSAGETAVDGQWASVFLANFHFAASGSNYLASLKPPSPLQNYWSLAVEEQFYIVYPTIFLIVAGTIVRRSLKVRLGVVLGLIMLGSYVLSIVMTSSNPSGAFFSPFTRAWELALGGLVALGSDRLQRLPQAVAASISWLGLGLILFAAFAFTSATSYPGWLVAIPVIGAALIIAGGAAQPKQGVETLLGLRPFQWLGLVSYSLYLWHWPILTIAAQSQGKTSLPVGQNLLWVLLSLVLAIGTYLVIENPIRHSGYLISRRWASVALGIALIVSGLFVSTVVRQNAGAGLLGNVATAASGSKCIVPAKVDIAALRSAYLSDHGSATDGHPTHPLRVVVVGDSTACTMLPGLDAVAPSYGIQIGNGAVLGCGIVSGRLAPFYYYGVNLVGYSRDCQREANHAESSAIRREKPQIIVWGSTLERSSIAINTPTGSKVLITGTPQWHTVMLQRIGARVRQFASTGAKVVLLLQPPFVNDGSPTRPTPDDVDFERMNAILREVAAGDPDQVRLIDLESRVCPAGPPCPGTVDGLEVRTDHEHYGPAGSLWVAEWLVPKLAAADRTHS